MPEVSHHCSLLLVVAAHDRLQHDFVFSRRLRHGLGRHVLCRHGLCRHGLCRHGLCRSVSALGGSTLGLLRVRGSFLLSSSHSSSSGGIILLLLFVCLLLLLLTVVKVAVIVTFLLLGLLGRRNGLLHTEGILATFASARAVGAFSGGRVALSTFHHRQRKLAYSSILRLCPLAVQYGPGGKQIFQTCAVFFTDLWGYRG